MARDFKIEITEAQIGQWVQFSVPASTTGFPCFSVGQLGGAINISYSPDGENAKPLLLNGIVPQSVTLYCRAFAPATAILTDFFFHNRVLISGGGGGGGGGTTYTFDNPLTESGGVVSLNLSSNLKLTGNELDISTDPQTTVGTLELDVANLQADVGDMSLLPLSTTTLVGGINAVKDNAVLLTGDQSVLGTKTFTNGAVFNGYVTKTNKTDMNTPSSINDFVLRFIGDSWSNNQTTDLIRFHKGGARSGYKVYLSSGNFNYAEWYGLTLISNMKDPTEASHGANKRYVDSKTLVFQSNEAITTSNLPVGALGSKLSATN